MQRVRCNMYELCCLMCWLPQLLYDTIKLCLVKASAARMTSIAFPTVGCGRLDYDPRDVADCFVHAQRDTGCQLQVRVCQTVNEIDLIVIEKSCSD